MRGNPPSQYFFDSSPDHNPEDVFRAFDGFADETFVDEPESYHNLIAWVVLPPMHYEGKLVKGILISASIELLIEKRPELCELFHTVATPRYPNIPWSQSADYLMYAYDCPARYDWFYKEYPHRQYQLLIPFEHEADAIHEYYVAPYSLSVEKSIDILCISRLFEQKNLPLVLSAASLYCEKYSCSELNMTIVFGCPINEDFVFLSDGEKDQYLELQKMLLEVHSSLKVTIINHIPYGPELFKLYSQAKVYTVGSLLEGKNRSQREAQFCDTPVVMFEAFNQYIRGNEKIFPDGSGLLAPEFTAESLADTWYQVLQNPEAFKPRKNALKNYGKKNYFNRLLSHLPYYQEEIPDFDGSSAISNLWLDLAIHSNYQLSLHEWIYGNRFDLTYAHGVDAALKLMDQYLDLFDIPVLSSKLRAFAARPTAIPK